MLWQKRSGLERLKTSVSTYTSYDQKVVHMYFHHILVSVLSAKVSRLECCEWSLATKSVTKVSYILAENVEYL